MNKYTVLMGEGVRDVCVHALCEDIHNVNFGISKPEINLRRQSWVDTMKILGNKY